MRPIFRKLEKTQRIAETVLTVSSWVVTLSLTLLIVVDVTARFFFNEPLPATWEIGEVCMPYIVFFPFAYALSTDSHVRVSVLMSLLSPRAQRVLKIITDLISIGICGLLTYMSWLRFWESFTLMEEMLAAVRILWWWGKIAMPIGMGLFTISYLVQVFHSFGRPQGQD